MNTWFTRMVLGLGAFIALLTVASVSATTTFRYSSVGDSATGWGNYNSVSISDQGSGSYGFLQTPDGVRGGWSTRSSSGGFGYATDTDYSMAGNQGGFTTLAVTSHNFRGSYGNGYGSFVVGGGRLYGDPYYGSRSGAWNTYPANIPYVSQQGGWSTGGYSYGSRGWY